MFFLKKNHLSLLAAALLLLACYYGIFESFFPGKAGKLGHDYAYFLPVLLDGYFWYHTNGLWHVPWFTPSFCGGWPNYANVQSCYYTLPQLFTLYTDPLHAVRLTLLLFAGLGFLGFYLMLRRAFLTSQPTAILGAGLFLFNGFYSHRMLIGHFGDCSFMLLPLILLALLRPLPDEKKARRRQLLFDSVMGGLLITYMIQSGFGPYVIPVGIAIVLIALIHGILYGWEQYFWMRWIGAGVTAGLLCASKLTAIYYLMSNFPRNTYKLPGVEGFLNAVWLMLKSLFFSPAFDPYRFEMLTNVQWALQRHEWEYSITVVPLVIIIYGLWCLVRRMRVKEFPLNLSWQQWLQSCAVIILLILPILVNTYSPGWNAFLKKLPLIKSASTLIRWFIVYIPVTILAAALMLEKTIVSPKYKTGIVIICLVAVVSLNANVERDFYKIQVYDPGAIVKSYQQVKAGLWEPEIEQIAVYMDPDKKVLDPFGRNDLLVDGKSQLLCYEVLFGYQLENFPRKKLHPGLVLEEEDGILNIKNPACYVWPQANGCQPGDHFAASQKAQAEAFLNYRPYTFQITTIQKIANRINLLGLVAVGIFLMLYGSNKILAVTKQQTSRGSDEHPQ